MSSINFTEHAWSYLQDLLQTEKAVILCDTNTKQCLTYLNTKCEATSGLPIIEIKAGEAHKHIETCTYVWNELKALGADRHTVLLNLGGGVITDLGGFVAATYMRGIRCVNIPTSLMGMVDAAIGGKTGVDLGVLKNQVGLFSQPKAVLIDNGFLKTLSEREYNNGLAEVLKHAFISEPSILTTLDEVENLISRSVKVKTEIVELDELEKGERKKLNFGHTIGHAIESHFLNSDKPILHGEAVAAGMIMAGFVSKSITGLEDDDLHSLISTTDSIFKRVNLSEEDWRAIKSLLIHDKKNRDDKVQFVLLAKLGEAIIDQEVSEEELDAAFRFYSRSL